MGRQAAQAERTCRDLCGGSDHSAREAGRRVEHRRVVGQGWQADRGGRRLLCLALRRGGGELMGSVVELLWCGFVTRRVTLCRRMGTTADLMWARWRFGWRARDGNVGWLLDRGVGGLQDTGVLVNMRGSMRRVRGGYLSR